jgi:hypothetical protein
MMTFDVKVPLSLRSLQEWFGPIISQPLAHHGGIVSKSEDGRSIKKEAQKHINPSPALKPFERLQIYNQQYWWRLLNTLQETFPFLTRLFGYRDFNEDLAIPFLRQYPPSHWSLRHLGEQLPEWIRSRYKAEDAALVYAVAHLDRAYHDMFFKPHLESLTPPENFEDLLKETLYLQPHAALFEHPYDLFTWRLEFLKENPDYWTEHDFPELKKEKTFTILLRTMKGAPAWRPIVEAEYLLLRQLEKGASVDSLCEWLEKQPNRVREEAEKSLQKWFEEWTRRGILTLVPYAGT